MQQESFSQISAWNFKPEHIHDLRVRANKEAYLFVKKRNAAEDKSLVSIPMAHSFAKKYTGHKNGGADDDAEIMNMEMEDVDAKFPSVEDELILLNFYCKNLLALIGPNASTRRLERDIKVASTASVLLRRFFLSNSIVLFDPKAIMVAAAFLASKVEDATCDIRYLEDGTKAMQAHVSIKEIIGAEVDLLAGINFDLCCIHPFKIVLAYTEDLRTFLKSKEGKKCVVNQETVSGEDLRPIYDGARNIVEKIMFGSDIMLYASAGKIGLAAMMLANDNLIQGQGKGQGQGDGKENQGDNNSTNSAIKIDFKGYMHCRFTEEKKEHEIESSWQDVVSLCHKLRDAAATSEPDMTILKSAHKKLKKSRVWGEQKSSKKRKRPKENK
jgi:cyclin H